VGNRGSKSVVVDSYSTVKEQRVNGSWCGINFLHLRCTLMGFEKNYQVKIPSNQIIQNNFIRLLRLAKLGPESNLNNAVINKLPMRKLLIEPWFISGFTDAVKKKKMNFFFGGGIKRFVYQ